MSTPVDSASEKDLEEFYFVYPMTHGFTAKVTTDDLEAFSFLRDRNNNCVRIREDKLNDELVGMSTSVFVVSKFEYDFVKRLTASDRVVLTPLAILYHKKYGIPLIKQVFPYKSHCMSKIRISTTGFSSENRRKYRKMIEEMAGLYREEYKTHIDVLVSDTVLSKKYRVACSKNANIVSKDWILDCYNVHQKDIKLAIEILEPYRLKCFHNLRICLSGISFSERDRIKQKIESNSGVYCPSLDVSVNVLICNDVKTDKFRFAKMKNIAIVNKKWFYKSINSGHVLPFEQFIVDCEASSNVVTSSSILTDQSHVSETNINSNGNEQVKRYKSPEEWEKEFLEWRLKNQCDEDVEQEKNRKNFFNVTSSSDVSTFETSWERSEQDYFVQKKKTSPKDLKKFTLSSSGSNNDSSTESEGISGQVLLSSMESKQDSHTLDEGGSL